VKQSELLNQEHFSTSADERRNEFEALLQNGVSFGIGIRQRAVSSVGTLQLCL
jgi:hypothetical protein